MSNVFYHPFNPIGSQLSGMVGHPRQARPPPSSGYKSGYLPEAAEHIVSEMYKRPRLGSRFSKRPRRTRKRRGLRRRPIPRALAPPTKLIRCKACQYLNYTPAGTLTKYETQLNSITDPFVGSGTGQPLGFDQWAALYRYAYVLSSKVIAKVHNNGSVAAMFGITPCKLNQGTISLASYAYYMELPETKSRVLSQETDHVTLTHSVSVKKFLQIKDLRDDKNYRMDIVSATNPTDIAYWHLWGQAMDSAGTIDLDAAVTMEYIVLLVDPIIPARSAV